MTNEPSLYSTHCSRCEAAEKERDMAIDAERRTQMQMVEDAKERDALRAKLEIANRKAETLQRALDGSRAEVFRLADKLRAIDAAFQSPMMLNKIVAP